MQSETLRQLQSQYELLLRDGDPASRASAWQTIVDMKVGSWNAILGVGSLSFCSFQTFLPKESISYV